MGRHTTADHVVAAEPGFVLTPPAHAPDAGKPKRHPCRAKACPTWVAPHRLLCDACWLGTPLELRRAFLATAPHSPERAAAVEVLVRGAGPSAEPQPALPGVSVRRRHELLTPDEMATAAARFIGPPTPEERQRKAAVAACEVFNEAHPIRSHVEVHHGGRRRSGVLHGAAAALPPSWQPTIVVKFEGTQALQLPITAICDNPTRKP